MRRFLKILGYGLAGLVILIGIAATAVYIVSNGRMKKTYAVAPRSVAIPTDAVAVAHGKHLAETRGCNDCHGKDYAGSLVIKDAAMGTLYGPNLTRGKGGRMAMFKDEDWVRALVQEDEWIVISGDHRIDRNPHLRQAWRQSGLIVFFLSKAWTTIPPLQQHSKLALILSAIIERAQRAAPGSGFSISLNGKIEQIYS